MDYSIESKGTGTAMGSVLMDQTAFFTKKIVLEKGYLEW